MILLWSGTDLLNCVNLRGVQATHKDGKEHGIEFVEPPAGSVPGTRVYFDGDKYRGKSDLSKVH